MHAIFEARKWHFTRIEQLKQNINRLTIYFMAISLNTSFILKYKYVRTTFQVSSVTLLMLNTNFIIQRNRISFNFIFARCCWF